MGSPLPPDPYAALGLSKDATSAAIKTAYRKLVLKTHPDKFLDPAQKTEKSAEFHKIQQAYEILGDDDKRERYDAQVRLAELRKESMERQQTRGAAATKADPRAAPAPNYDIRQPSGATAYAARGTTRSYEEQSTRVYDEEDRYGEPRVRPRAKQQYSSYRSSRDESSSRRPSTFNIFVSTNHNDRAKTRDQQKRKERVNKFVPVHDDSDSDERYRQEERRRRDKLESQRHAMEEEDRKVREREAFRKQAEAAARRDDEMAKERERERARGRETSRRPSSRRPDVGNYDKYLNQEAAAKEHMSKHRTTSVPPEEAPARPAVSRSSTKYAQVRPKEKSSSKRSGSREPRILSAFRHTHGSWEKSRKPTKTAEAEYDEEPRRPALDKADSTPVTPRQAVRETQRSATMDSYDRREELDAPPKFRRAETMPMPKVSRHEDRSKASTSKLRTEVPRHMNDSGYSSPSTPSASDREKESRNATAPRMTRTAYRYGIEGADGGVAVSMDDDFCTVTVEPTSSSERISRGKVSSRSPIRERHLERDSDDSGRERIPRNLQEKNTARYTYPIETRPHMSRASTQQVPLSRSPQVDPYERGRTYVASPDHVRGQSHDDRGYERAGRSGVLYGEIPKHAGPPLRREEVPAPVRPMMRRNDNSYTKQDVQYSRKFTEADVRYASAAPRGRERSAYAFNGVDVGRPPMARGQTVM